MLKDKIDISRELAEFIGSPQFANFELIMEDMARSKFLEVQSNPDGSSHSDLIANRKILNFYLNIGRDLKFRLKAMEIDKIAQNQAKLEESERISE